MTVNTERLRKIADVIEANPDHFHMGLFWGVDGGSDPRVEMGVSGINGPTYVAALIKTDLTSCGTTACIAGWAVNLWPADVEPDDDVITAACRVLDMSERDADVLFMNFSLDADTAPDHLRELADAYDAGKDPLSERTYH